jgi:hypothetical protein
MNIYLVKLPVGDYTYGDDYAIVIVAEDERHAERRARWSSDSFKRTKKINISQVNLDTEETILKANVGG